MSSRALLVDDERDFLNHLSETLRHEGLQVTSAAAGEDALRRCQEEDFDLLITDLRLPGTVDGWDLIESARERNPRIDAVAVTAYPAEDHEDKVQTLNVFAYLEKPVPISSILNTVRWCMQKRQLEADLGALRTGSTTADSTTKALYKMYDSLPYPSLIVTAEGDLLLANGQAREVLALNQRTSFPTAGIAQDTPAVVRAILQPALASNSPEFPDPARITIGGKTYRARVWRIERLDPVSPLAIFLEPVESLDRALLDAETARVWLPILLRIAK